LYKTGTIARYTGASNSEVCVLKWCDIDFKERKIKLFGKGAKERIIPIPEILLKFLREKDRKDEFVLPGTRNNSEIWRQFNKYLTSEEVDIHDASFHTLRHTYASELAQAGRPLIEIRDLLGHTEIKTTMIYSHLAPENLRDAVSVFDR
jgi:integrase